MAEVPQYQSNAAIQPAGVPDYQSSAERLAASFQKVADIAGQEQRMLNNDQARKEGEQAGSQAGFQPQKPRNEREMIFQNAAIEAHKSVVQTDIADNIQRIREDVLDPKNFGPNALERYNKLSQAYEQGAFASMPKEVVPAAKNYFFHYDHQARNVINGRVNELTKNQMQEQLFDYINKMSKQAENEALSAETMELKDGTVVPVAGVTTSEINKKVDAAVSVGLLPGHTAATLKQGYTDQAHEYFYLGKFSQVLNNEPNKAGEFITNFLHSKEVDMNPIEKMKAVTKMTGMMHQYQQGERLNDASLNLQMKNAIAGVANGEPLTSYNNIITQVQQLAPKKFDSFMAQMKAANFSAAVGKAITFATPAEQDQILAASKPKPFLENGELDTTYADTIKVWNHMNDVARQVNKKWHDDPAKMAMQHPSVIHTFEAHNVAATGPDGKVQSTNTATINPVQQMINVQLQRGVPFNKLSVLTKDTAANTVDSLKNMDLPGQVANLDNMLRQYGEYAPIVSRDLQKAGLEFTPLLMVAVANNPESRGALSDVMKAMQVNHRDIEKALPAGASIKDVEKSASVSMMNWEAAIQQSYNGDTTQHRAEMRGAVTQYGAWLLASGKAKTPPAAAQAAADTLINNFYNYDKINGYKMALPKNVDSSLLNKAFEHLQNEATQSELVVPQLYSTTFHSLTNDGLQKQYKSDSVSQAHLAIEPGDRSAVLVDDQGSPITKKDGSTFRIEFDHLNNPLSEIRTGIEQHQASKTQRVLNQFAPNLTAKEIG